MDKFDKKLSEVFKKNIKCSNSYEYTINSTLNNIEVLANNVEEENILDEKNGKSRVNFRVILSLAACMILSFGIINSDDLAERIYEGYEESKNVEVAVVSTGINAKFNNDFIFSNGEITDLQNDSVFTQDSIKIAVDEIKMDDNLLRVTFDMELAKEISKDLKYVPNDSYYLDIELEDLMITDENNNVLYSADMNKAIESLNVGGDERNFLTQTTLKEELEKNEKYFAGNEKHFINSYNNGKVEIIYNFNLIGLNKYYPRSQKLNFDISKIKIINKQHTAEEEELYYSGKWNFNLDIPENVYSRKRVAYKMISNNIGEENEVLKFDVLQTCTEAKLSLKTIDRASLNPAPCLTLINSLEIGEPSTQIRDWFVDLFMASDEYKKYEDDLRKSYLISGEQFEDFEGNRDSGPYLENENGEKFGLSIGPYSNGGGNFTDDNFYQPSMCFKLTQEQMTDKLTLHFTYLEKEYVFELEKDGEV